MAKPSAEQVARQFLELVEKRALAVRNDAVQNLVEEMQTPTNAGGHMPVATGFLRASFVSRVGRSELPVTKAPPVSGGAKYDGGALVVTMLSAKLQDPITLGWTANYAGYAEHRSPFFRLGLQRWPQIVEKSKRAAKAAVESRGGTW